MILKMLIVDDEPIICKGLHTTIDWRDIDIEVVGTAHDGNEAVTLMKDQHVDIILTDVCMPEMDGLALSEHIITEYPKAKIIMISGFDEFKYARQALRLGVEDYLLKPVNIDELLTLVKNIKKVIIEDKKEEIQKEKMITSQWVLHYLFNAPLSLEMKHKSLTNAQHYRIVVSVMKDYDQKMRHYSTKEIAHVREEWKEQISHHLLKRDVENISVFSQDDELITICFEKNDQKLDDILFKELSDNIHHTLAFTIHFAISTLQNNLSNISSVYKDTSALMSESRGIGKTVLFLDQHSDFENEVTHQHHWIIENAKKYIQEHFNKDVKASELAEKHFITPNYFSVIFKQETGVSFSEYLNSIRIEKASELLLSTANKVFEIAEYVGYKEYKYFVQIFKRHTGVTPTYYRKINKVNIK
ncbi:response regulator transcription factor [Evansella cellulosilytica]|uniref:Two component transcriptional regulator, AraC family n=1 Tax=Evansella cellulosilytica (strain ATCC 21833 / DSM 2522 / FERM P-1141 / JCM 9156 / N-4) TaxID=649639 RepID=E6U0G8_EVAC2|nr:response regulator [Evansella cellulosilytica]ADU31413.1 two component transcriptional regulator, AraC family [Evansella cellulosilytica DSM 2522]